MWGGGRVGEGGRRTSGGCNRGIKGEGEKGRKRECEKEAHNCMAATTRGQRGRQRRGKGVRDL